MVHAVPEPIDLAGVKQSLNDLTGVEIGHCTIQLKGGKTTPMQTQARSDGVMTAERQGDLQLALRLTYITLGWMTIEGVASLLLGWASNSLLLQAFGIDSVIELFSGGVLLWRLKVEAKGVASAETVRDVEDRAAKWVGYSLYLLVVYVLLNSAYGLFIAKRVTDTHESVWGILIGLVAKIGMPVLAGYKLKVAARLDSRALRGDAVESLVCGYLSIVLIIGLAATRIFGWWWLDSVAALGLIPFIIKEAREAVHGGCDGCAT
jgi:divalent metal cation (Fe/Co/Zn/Cd) transporter